MKTLNYWLFAVFVAGLLAIALDSDGAAQIGAPAKAGVTAVWIKERGEDTVVPNGGNRTFILTHVPEDPTEIGVYLNGVFQSQNDDYLLLNQTDIVFMVAPSTSDRVRFWYRGIK